MDSVENACPILYAANLIVLSVLETTPKFEQFEKMVSCLCDNCEWWDAERECCSVQKGA